MKKALQDGGPAFHSMIDGRVNTWDSKVAEELLERVNQVLSGIPPESELYLPAEYGFWMAMGSLLDRLIQEGVTSKMIANLNFGLRNISFRHVLRLTDSGEPTWQYIADFRLGPDAIASAAYGFSHLLEVGALDGLKRCESTDCRNFFIGRPNAKWCSKRCGSRYRVRLKRQKQHRSTSQ